MKRLALIALLCLSAGVAPGQQAKSTDFAKVVQITRIATVNLPAKESRVVFAAEDSLDSMSLHRWVITVERYPANYRVSQAIFSAPPCAHPQMIKEVCSIQEIPGEPLFRGTFEIAPHFGKFAGSATDTAKKVLAFREQLKEHPAWTQPEIAAGLASAGAKFGPDRKKEFMGTLPLKSLRKALGPMQVKDVAFIQPNSQSSWPTYWKVRAILVGNPKTQLVMYFDPFEGQLQQLVVAGPVKVWDPVTRRFKWEIPEQ